MIDARHQPRAWRTAAAAVAMAAAFATLPRSPATTWAAPPVSDPETRGIRGDVTNEAGQPIAGATVRLLVEGLSALRREMRPEAWVEPVVVTTDEAGRFDSGELSGPVFTVRAEAPGLAPETFEGIPPGAWLGLRLRPGHEVRGVAIEDGGGRGIPAARVIACDAAGLPFGLEACNATDTDDDGAFRITAPVGEIQLRAHARGYAVSSLLVVELPAPGNVPAARLTLRPGARVTGRVVDERRRPVPDALVYVRPLAGQAGELARSDSHWPTHTDAEGAFVLEGVPSAATRGLFAFRADRDVAAGPHLRLEPGGDVEDVEILLPKPPTLVLQLVDESDEPVEDFELFFRATQRPSGDYVGPVEPGRIERGSSGRHQVRFPDSGSFDMLITPDGYAELDRPRVVLESGGTTDLGRLVVSEGAAIAGRITDASGEAIPEATVEASWEGKVSRRVRRVRADSSGRYRVGGLGETPASLVASADGFDPARLEDVLPGESDVELVLKRRGGLRGRVALEEGGAPEAFTIVIHVETDDTEADPGVTTGFPRENTFSDEEGSYRVDDVPPGLYTVEARAPGRVADRRTGVRVQPGEIADVAPIELGRGLALEGRVLARDDDSPVVGAAVEARREGGSFLGATSVPRHSANSDGDGRFRIEGLTEGPHVVKASSPEFAPARQIFDVEERTDPAEITLRLSRGGKLTGTARNAAGDPAVGRRILLARKLGDEDFDYATTDSAGRYEMQRLAPGSYVAAMAPSGAGSSRAIFKNVVIRDHDVTVLDFDEAAPITLSGTVYLDGEPVARAQLFFTKHVNLTDFKFSRTDTMGRYEVGLDEPGRYRVLLESREAGGSSTEITVPPEQHVAQDIFLGSDGIGGIVSDDEGRPVVGAVVSATADGPASSEAALLVAETGVDGRYAIHGLDEGIYRLTAAAPSFRIGIAYPVGITAGAGVVALDFRLERGGSFRGRLVDELGQGIAGAAILAAPAGTLDAWGTGAATAMTDVNGAFRLTSPGEGPIDVTALPSGWAPARLVGVLPPADPDELVLQASRGGGLVVQVIDAGGAPRAGVTVTVRAVPPHLGSELARLVSPMLPTDASGATRLSHLAPGLYAVSVPGLEGPPASVAVEEGGETLVSLELP